MSSSFARARARTSAHERSSSTRSASSSSISLSGKPWGDHALYHAFKGACRKVELTGFRFHDLRHAFVTELFRGGAPAPVVQRLAGHEHLTTTQRYAHAQLPDLTAAVARLSW